MKENVQVVDSVPLRPSKGSAGLNTQLPGQSTTVSNAARATGGIGRGKLMETETK